MTFDELMGGAKRAGGRLMSAARHQGDKAAGALRAGSSALSLFKDPSHERAWRAGQCWAAEAPDERRAPAAPDVPAPGPTLQSSSERRGRAAERARCQAILMSQAGLRNLQLAKQFAFETDLAPNAAVTLLARLPAPPDRNAIAAARATHNPRLGAGGSMGILPEHAVAAHWDRAFSVAAGRR